MHPQPPSRAGAGRHGGCPGGDRRPGPGWTEPVMRGYWQRPEETGQGAPRRLAAHGGQGARRRGGLTSTPPVAARTRSVSAGAKVLTPAEIERVLRAHPEVVDAAVIGIPDDQVGEAVVADRHAPRRDHACSRRDRGVLQGQDCRLQAAKTRAFLSDTLPLDRRREGQEGRAARRLRRREMSFMAGRTLFADGRVLDVGGIDLCGAMTTARPASRCCFSAGRRSGRRPLRLRAAAPRGVPGLVTWEPRGFGPSGCEGPILGRRLGRRPRKASRHPRARARPHLGERFLVLHRLRSSRTHGPSVSGRSSPTQTSGPGTP